MLIIIMEIDNALIILIMMNDNTNDNDNSNNNGNDSDDIIYNKNGTFIIYSIIN